MSRPSKKVQIDLPYSLNEKVEKYMKKVELSTGKKPSKAEAIINILNNSI